MRLKLKTWDTKTVSFFIPAVSYWRTQQSIVVYFMHWRWRFTWSKDE